MNDSAKNPKRPPATAARSNPLVKALTNPEDAQDQLRLRTATIIAVSKASTPWRATIRLGDLDIPNVTMAGWYDPVVGDNIQLLQQGPQLWILGPSAPAKLVVVAPPTPPTPPPAPPAPPTIRTVPITAIDSAAWQFSYSTWRTDRFIQGGVGVGRYRPFWFYGNQIAAAKGAGTIIGGSIFIKRDTEGGVNAGANVRLGTHGFQTRPGDGSGALVAVEVVKQLGKGQGDSIPIPAGMIAQLNAGAAGFGLEPGVASYTHPDYMPSFGRQSGEWSGQLSLTIQG